jgi:hypothetical protein
MFWGMYNKDIKIKKLFKKILICGRSCPVWPTWWLVVPQRRGFIMINDFRCEDLYTFFHEVLADVADCGADDASVTSSEDNKELTIILTYDRVDGTHRTWTCTYKNTETYWQTMYNYIDRVKGFVEEYNKLTDNGTAEPAVRVRSLFRAFDRRVRVCGCVGYY